MKRGENTTLSLSNLEAEIGYWIGKPYWGKGYAPEALTEMIRWAFLELHLQQLWCGYYEGNIQSRIVQEKCRFQYQFSKQSVYVELLDEYRTEHFTAIRPEILDYN